MMIRLLPLLGMRQLSRISAKRYSSAIANSGVNISLENTVEREPSKDSVSVIESNELARAEAGGKKSIVFAAMKVEKDVDAYLERNNKSKKARKQNEVDDKILFNAPLNTSESHSNNTTVRDDLEFIVSLSKEDETIKLIESLSLQQLIRVITLLSTRRHRSTPLLRALAHNISNNSTKLTIKQGAGVLYALVSLSFPDQLLLDRIIPDIRSSLDSNVNPSVVRSVVTSIGLLRYRDIDLLEQISAWVFNNLSKCQTQDITALFVTLATVNYAPSNLEELFKMCSTMLSEQNLPSASSWLTTVWALLVLEHANSEQVASILSPVFHKKLFAKGEDKVTNVGTKLKLLNINAGAKYLLPSYRGPLLQDLTTFEVPIIRSKEKEVLVNSVLETLTNLFPSSSYLKTNIDTEMGFILDAECLIDHHCNPLPLTVSKTSGKNLERKATKIAVMTWEYNDMCRGVGNILGGKSLLAVKLLEARGYKVLQIPYTNFNTRENLARKVQLIEQQLRALATSRS